MTALASSNQKWRGEGPAACSRAVYGVAPYLTNFVFFVLFVVRKPAAAGRETMVARFVLRIVVGCQPITHSPRLLQTVLYPSDFKACKATSFSVVSHRCL